METPKVLRGTGLLPAVGPFKVSKKTKVLGHRSLGPLGLHPQRPSLSASNIRYMLKRPQGCKVLQRELRAITSLSGQK